MEELPLFPQPPTKVLSVHKLKPKPKGLFVIHINIRNLLAHLDEIYHLLSSLKPDILGISETWLDDSVDGEIHFLIITSLDLIEIVMVVVLLHLLEILSRLLVFRIFLFLPP